MTLDQIVSNYEAGLGHVADLLKAKGVRCIIVACDDKNTAPFVYATVEKRDVTQPMVEGLVYTLLQQAGIQNPSSQAAMAARFVAGYVQKL